MCEEFGALPSAVLREIAIVPSGLLEEIIEARAYANVKAAIDARDRAAGGTKSELEQLAMLIDANVAIENRDE